MRPGYRRATIAFCDVMAIVAIVWLGAFVVSGFRVNPVLSVVDLVGTVAGLVIAAALISETSGTWWDVFLCGILWPITFVVLAGRFTFGLGDDG